MTKRLNKELIAIIRSTDIRSRLAAQGAEVVTMTPAELDSFFGKERSRWASVVSAARIRLD
jgi:tripartite-type tricarboxylate transporter receptor subunit TctC